MIPDTMSSSHSSPPCPGYPPSHGAYLRRSSPPGSPAPKKCCFDKKNPYPKESFLCWCYTCSVAKTTSVLASIGICLLVIIYTVIGAFTFMALEGGVHNETAVAASIPSPGSKSTIVSELRSHTVDRLWNITMNLNILYREDWTRLAAEEVLEFQEALVRALRTSDTGGTYVTSARDGTVYYAHGHRWSFSSSFLYSLTLITTIGYGSVSPRTAWGKLVTILYALVGIPLMLIYLSRTGDVLARSFRRLYGKFCGTQPVKSNAPGNGDCPCVATVKVPVSLCLILVVGYVCCGAVLFHLLENWSMLEGWYFCFTSLGTIGFGDLMPGQHAGEVSLCACSIYILAGMALVAMCVSLVQEQVSSLLKLIGATCTSKPRTQDQEEIAMSVVSS